MPLPVFDARTAAPGSMWYTRSEELVEFVVYQPDKADHNQALFVSVEDGEEFQTTVYGRYDYGRDVSLCDIISSELRSRRAARCSACNGLHRAMTLAEGCRCVIPLEIQPLPDPAFDPVLLPIGMSRPAFQATLAQPGSFWRTRSGRFAEYLRYEPTVTAVSMRACFRMPSAHCEFRTTIYGRYDTHDERRDWDIVACGYCSDSPCSCGQPDQPDLRSEGERNPLAYSRPGEPYDPFRNVRFNALLAEIDSEWVNRAGNLVRFVRLDLAEGVAPNQRAGFVASDPADHGTVEFRTTIYGHYLLHGVRSNMDVMRSPPRWSRCPGCGETGMCMCQLPAFDVEAAELAVRNERSLYQPAAMRSDNSRLVQAHQPGCRFLRALQCTTPAECPHGHDVCPICDPCTCPPQLATAPHEGLRFRGFGV